MAAKRNAVTIVIGDIVKLTRLEQDLSPPGPAIPGICD
jgi:hypothetical protein